MAHTCYFCACANLLFLKHFNSWPEFAGENTGILVSKVSVMPWSWKVDQLIYLENAAAWWKPLSVFLTSLNVSFWLANVTPASLFFWSDNCLKLWIHTLTEFVGVRIRGQKLRMYTSSIPALTNLPFNHIKTTKYLDNSNYSQVSYCV